MVLEAAWPVSKALLGFFLHAFDGLGGSWGRRDVARGTRAMVAAGSPPPEPYAPAGLRADTGLTQD